MANPFFVPPPDVSGGLEALMKGVQGMQVNSARQQAVQSMQNGDTRGALARLMSIGDMQGATALSNFGNQDFERNYKTKMLDIAERNATRQETPAQLQMLKAAGINPTSPEGRKALFPRTDTPISATDKKAIFEAEDAMPQLQGTKEALARAAELNDKTFSGAGAGTRAWLGSNLPDLMVPDMVADKKTADSTTEWQKIMGPEALQQMAGTLKGATTDFELKKFIEMLGDPATPPQVRKSIIQRMSVLTDRKMELNNSRLKDLRGGDYFKPGGGQSKPTSSAPDAAVQALRGNPQLKDQFEAKYGPGSAAHFLGQ